MVPNHPTIDTVEAVQWAVDWLLQGEEASQ